ncbi:MAG: glucose-1-phosphate adenylyltransferase, partial [Chloroflexi bacterium]|nr:glucose-1-phosphate adenylyltransferase [Chloroflexota bacterium]
MKTRVVILAGGEGSRLGVLTAKRSKPSVPFAGKYRIIDFALSNCVNSNLFDVMLLTQYRPHSLVEHIGSGRPWDLDRS